MGMSRAVMGLFYLYLYLYLYLLCAVEPILLKTRVLNFGEIFITATK
jgi:hypothetical protein